jgi:hypothetical protein
VSKKDLSETTVEKKANGCKEVGVTGAEELLDTTHGLVNETVLK